MEISCDWAASLPPPVRAYRCLRLRHTKRTEKQKHSTSATASRPPLEKLRRVCNSGTKKREPDPEGSGSLDFRCLLLADAGQVERDARAEHQARVVRGHLRRGRHAGNLRVLDVRDTVARVAREREAGLHGVLHHAHEVEADRAALELEIGAAGAGDLTTERVVADASAQAEARRGAAREEVTRRRLESVRIEVRLVAAHLLLAAHEHRLPGRGEHPLAVRPHAQAEPAAEPVAELVHVAAALVHGGDDAVVPVLHRDGAERTEDLATDRGRRSRGGDDRDATHREQKRVRRLPNHVFDLPVIDARPIVSPVAEWRAAEPDSLSNGAMP